MKDEIFCSIDVETDGPIPGRNSMLSFGCYAFKEDGTEIGTFERNLYQMSFSAPDIKTMEWWKTQPEAWKACRTNLVDPRVAVYDFVKWLKGLPGKPVFVGYPALFDQMFIHWYCVYYAQEDPLGFSGIDIKSYAACLLKIPYRNATKKHMPKRWFIGTPKHDHTALQDAKGQGILFLNMLKENK